MELEDTRSREFEETALRTTLIEIAAQIKATSFNPGADEWASYSIEKHLSEEVQRLKAAAQSAYYARLDFRRAESVTKRFYISKYISLKMSFGRIIYWAAPIASLVHTHAVGLASYEAPAGTIRGHVFLQRRLLIEGSYIQDITDTFYCHENEDIDKQKHKVDDHQLTASEVRDTTSDSIISHLVTVLKQISPGTMREIVATIQKEQYSLISQPLLKGLIIEGPAGSGKTAVALHRVAYLLYNYGPLSPRIELLPEFTLILGPSKLFLAYISNVLPSLLVNGIAQTTFERYGWFLLLPPAKNDRDKTKRVEIVQRITAYDEPIDRWLDQTSDLATMKTLRGYIALHIKYSLRMLYVLNNYYKQLSSNRRVPKRGFKVAIDTFPGQSLAEFSISQEEMSVILDDAKHIKLPYWKQREHVFNKVESIALHNLPTSFASITDEPRRKNKESRFIRKMKALLNDYLTKDCRWESFIPLSEYTWNMWNELYQNGNWPANSSIGHLQRLLLNRDFLAGCLASSGEALFNDKEIEAIVFNGSFKHPERQRENLALILYLEHLFAKPLRPTLQHIVVDEAQDFSQMQCFILGLLSQNQSFTFLGDLDQSLFPYRNASSWNDIVKAFAMAQEPVDSNSRDLLVQEGNLEHVYRSTSEIATFASYIKNSETQADALTDIRHGPPPQLVACSNSVQSLTVIAKIIEARLRKSFTVALLTKTVNSAELLIQKLREHFIKQGSVNYPIKLLRDISLQAEQSAGTQTLTGLLCGPIWQAKGLEFDAVIIPDIDDETYLNTPLDRAMLYVAATRAMHELFIFWNGSPSPLLTKYIEHHQPLILE